MFLDWRIAFVISSTHSIVLLLVSILWHFHLFHCTFSHVPWPINGFKVQLGALLFVPHGLGVIHPAIKTSRREGESGQKCNFPCHCNFPPSCIIIVHHSLSWDLPALSARVPCIFPCICCIQTRLFFFFFLPSFRTITNQKCLWDNKTRVPKYFRASKQIGQHTRHAVLAVNKGFWWILLRLWKIKKCAVVNTGIVFRSFNYGCLLWDGVGSAWRETRAVVVGFEPRGQTDGWGGAQAHFVLLASGSLLWTKGTLDIFATEKTHLSRGSQSWSWSSRQGKLHSGCCSNKPSLKH